MADGHGPAPLGTRWEDNRGSTHHERGSGFDDRSTSGNLHRYQSPERPAIIEKVELQCAQRRRGSVRRDLE